MIFKTLSGHEIAFILLTCHICVTHLTCCWWLHVPSNLIWMSRGEWEECWEKYWRRNGGEKDHWHTIQTPVTPLLNNSLFPELWAAWQQQLLIETPNSNLRKALASLVLYWYINDQALEDRRWILEKLEMQQIYIFGWALVLMVGLAGMQSEDKIAVILSSTSQIPRFLQQHFAYKCSKPSVRVIFMVDKICKNESDV